MTDATPTALGAHVSVVGRTGMSAERAEVVAEVERILERHVAGAEWNAVKSALYSVWNDVRALTRPAPRPEAEKCPSCGATTNTSVRVWPYCDHRKKWGKFCPTCNQVHMGYNSADTDCPTATRPGFQNEKSGQRRPDGPPPKRVNPAPNWLIPAGQVACEICVRVHDAPACEEA